MSSQARPTSVYIHFPWCARKCPYCDFATRPMRPEAVAHEAYAEAVLAELQARAPSLHGRELKSIFFGGGTPSLWKPEVLGRVSQRIAAAFERRTDELEITVECNPSSLSRAHAAALVEQGVNRISIGVQSLRDEHLSFLGRLHDRKMALEALEGAVREVPRVSADLMFGMPGQTVERFSEDIEQLLGTGIEHVSSYALTIEPETPFGALHRRGKLRVCTDELYAELFEHAQACFEAAGWTQYEVSNYARPGQESRHNAHYWEGGDYLGLGAAAVGCLSEAPGRALRWRNALDPDRYVAKPGADAEIERLGPQDLVRESLMLGLRTKRGMDLAETATRSGTDPRLGRERALEHALNQGDLVQEGARLRVPKERWLRLDGIVRELF